MKEVILNEIFLFSVKKIHQLPDKYSAEEKVVEKSDEEEEEAFDKPVAEIRERIEKRLSAERSIPASSQRKEIVQEITTIKQQSLVEDKLAEVEQKVQEQKEITKPTMTKVLPSHPEMKTVSKTVEIKTTETPSEPAVSETVTTTTVITTTETRTTVPEETTHSTEDMELLKGVTQSFERIKTPVVKLLADEGETYFIPITCVFLLSLYTLLIVMSPDMIILDRNY